MAIDRPDFHARKSARIASASKATEDRRATAQTSRLGFTMVTKAQSDAANKAYAQAVAKRERAKDRKATYTLISKVIGGAVGVFAFLCGCEWWTNLIAGPDTPATHSHWTSTWIGVTAAWLLVNAVFWLAVWLCRRADRAPPQPSSIHGPSVALGALAVMAYDRYHHHH